MSANPLTPLLQSMEVQSALLGTLIGILVDNDTVSRDELLRRIEALNGDRPQFQQLLLAIVQQALSDRH